MKSLSWIALYPEIYENERRLVEQQYRGLALCETLLARGQLAYHGEITLNDSTGVSKHKILLIYPEVFPYRVPEVIPLQFLPSEEPHESWKIGADIISARHQMADGRLCLVEQDPFREAAGLVRGVDVLRRARNWFFGIKSGHNPFDSLEADLQSHFQKAADILIGPEFFSEELQRGGHFYAARLIESDSPRLVGLALSSDFDEIPKFKDCRQSLERPFPWIKRDFWNAAQQIAKGAALFREAIEQGVVVRGYWWELNCEPKPPRTGYDVVHLLSAGDEQSSLESVLDFFRGDLSTEPFLHIGLRYPGRGAGCDWLFLLIRLRSKREANPLVMTTKDKLALLGRSQVFSLHRHRLIGRELAFRNQRRVPTNISETKVSILGTGALGSQVADLLVKAGLGAVGLHDRDIMTVGNVSRHECGIECFGEPKVAPVALHLIQHNPFVKIDGVVGDITLSFETIDESLSDADFAISTIADESAEAAINQVAVARGRTVYYARAMRGGSVGRIFRVIPGRDACRYCISRFMAGSSKNTGEFAWLRIPETEDSLLGHECGNPIIAGSAADLSIVASLTARIILNEMTNGFGNENHWLWTSEAIPNHSLLTESYQLVSRRLAPDPTCPFCSDPPVVRVVVPKHIQSQIEALSIASGENETGGILVGYFTEDLAAVVTDASDAGPKPESSPTHFSRDVEYTQSWFEERVLRAPRAIEYIGEWHSHPSQDTRPSFTDISSLTGIARAQNYLCSKPVALILGCVDRDIVARSAYSFAPERPFRAIGYLIEDQVSADSFDCKTGEILAADASGPLRHS